METPLGNAAPSAALAWKDERPESNQKRRIQALATSQPDVVQRQKLQALAHKSPYAQRVAQFQQKADKRVSPALGDPSHVLTHLDGTLQRKKDMRASVKNEEKGKLHPTIQFKRSLKDEQTKRDFKAFDRGEDGRKYPSLEAADEHYAKSLT
ncbi:MAG: hypothetical protein AAFU03_12440, partial [Bacteroidota bacterium]